MNNDKLLFSINVSVIKYYVTHVCLFIFKNFGHMILNVSDYFFWKNVVMVFMCNRGSTVYSSPKCNYAENNTSYFWLDKSVSKFAMNFDWIKITKLIKELFHHNNSWHLTSCKDQYIYFNFIWYIMKLYKTGWKYILHLYDHCGLSVPRAYRVQHRFHNPFPGCEITPDTVPFTSLF